MQKPFKESGQHLTGGPIQCTACGQRCQILEGAGRLLVVVEVVVVVVVVVNWMFEEVKTVISGPRQTLSHQGPPDGYPR